MTLGLVTLLPIVIRLKNWSEARRALLKQDHQKVSSCMEFDKAQKRSGSGIWISQAVTLNRYTFDSLLSCTPRPIWYALSCLAQSTRPERSSDLKVHGALYNKMLWWHINIASCMMCKCASCRASGGSHCCSINNKYSLHSSPWQFKSSCWREAIKQSTVGSDAMHATCTFPSSKQWDGRAKHTLKINLGYDMLFQLEVALQNLAQADQWSKYTPMSNWADDVSPHSSNNGRLWIGRLYIVYFCCRLALWFLWSYLGICGADFDPQVLLFASMLIYQLKIHYASNEEHMLMVFIKNSTPWCHLL